MKKYKIKNMLKSLLVLNLDTFSNNIRKSIYLAPKEISSYLSKEDIESKEVRLNAKHKIIKILEFNLPEKKLPEEKVKVNSPVLKKNQQIKNKQGKKK